MNDLTFGFCIGFLLCAFIASNTYKRKLKEALARYGFIDTQANYLKEISQLKSVAEQPITTEQFQQLSFLVSEMLEGNLSRKMFDFKTKEILNLN